MPRSTADRRSRIISCLSGIGLSSWLIPMQPSPSAETSRLLFPSVRFCIVPPDASVLVVRHLFHPVHDLAIEVLLNGDVRDGGGCRGAVPMFLTRRDPDHVTGPNLL